MVAHGDGLLDGLEADAVLGEAGNGQGAGDGAGGEHQFVVAEQFGAARVRGGEGGDGGGARRVVDGGRLADDDMALVEDAAQRHDDMAG